ncbi:unnamed protein product [Adineta steineri]|uniref:EF-hand domain-containing protein n=1 Tax=Adineta steineri TaxID=433720 RepID=A0A819NHF4_9BILA|nr:unnamed protein product [Adineta steineri]
MSKNLNEKDLKKLFNTFDNGDGKLSLAEIQTAINEHYPHIIKHKNAIKRAFKNADKSGDGSIEFNEFSTLIRWLNRYDELKKLFQQIDVNDDHQISINEFIKGHELLNLNTQLLQLKFNSVDRNHSGYIIFDEVKYFHYYI